MKRYWSKTMKYLEESSGIKNSINNSTIEFHAKSIIGTIN